MLTSEELRARLRGMRLRPRLARAPLAAAGAVIIGETTINLVNSAFGERRVPFLDSADEWSYSHVLGSAAFAAGAVVCAGGALHERRRRVAWSAAAALFAFLLADNLTRLHEHIAFWPAVYAPVLLSLSASILLAARDTAEAPLVVAGLAIMFGSLAIHVFGPYVVRRLGWEADSWAYQVKVGLKEGSELAGWVILVPALARLAGRRGRTTLGRRTSLRIAGNA